MEVRCRGTHAPSPPTSGCRITSGRTRAGRATVERERVQGSTSTGVRLSASDASAFHYRLERSRSALGPGSRRVRPAHQEAGAWDAPYGRERLARRKRELRSSHRVLANQSLQVVFPGWQFEAGRDFNQMEPVVALGTGAFAGVNDAELARKTIGLNDLPFLFPEQDEIVSLRGWWAGNRRGCARSA